MLEPFLTCSFVFPVFFLNSFSKSSLSLIAKMTFYSTLHMQVCHFWQTKPEIWEIIVLFALRASALIKTKSHSTLCTISYCIFEQRWEVLYYHHHHQPLHMVDCSISANNMKSPGAPYEKCPEITSTVVQCCINKNRPDKSKKNKNHVLFCTFRLSTLHRITNPSKNVMIYRLFYIYHFISCLLHHIY